MVCNMGIDPEDKGYEEKREEIEKAYNTIIYGTGVDNTMHYWNTKPRLNPEAFSLELC